MSIIRPLRIKVLFHELVHAATTNRDKYGESTNVGFRESNFGIGLNEGATEYFAQKMYSKIEKIELPTSYFGLVSIAKDLVNLYGENVILDAMINGPEKLEGLMEKDGKSYVELREFTDDYYRCIYRNRFGFLGKIISEFGKNHYLKAGNFIEQIKQKRAIDNPKILDVPSEWKEYLVSLAPINMLAKIKERYNNNKKLLSQGSEIRNFDDENRENFRNSLRKENFGTELDDKTVIKNEANNSKENNIGDNEKGVFINYEK